MCNAGGGAGDPRPMTLDAEGRGSALRMTEELMEMVAHDLRSPLACVLANAELLADWVRRTQKSAEPTKPSHDFFGEMTGAIGCLPKSTPAM